jgi:ubiquinone/menaquinone biosynthesis C-methylase UbiE
MTIRNRIARAAVRRLAPQFSSPHGPLGLVAGAIMRRRNNALNVAVVDVAGVRPGDCVLDVGCGPGNAVLEAAGRVGSGRAHGVDASPAMVRMARRRLRGRPNAHIYRGSAEHLPLADTSIDVAWAVNSLHHWSDVAAGLSELHRVLVPGGRAVVVERLGPPTGPHRPHGAAPSPRAVVGTAHRARLTSR